MSDRDFMNLDDDALDTGAPVGDDQWDADLLGDFPEDDPAAEDAAIPLAAAPARASRGEPAAPAAAAPGRTSPPPRRKRGAARGGGALCFLLVVLAGLTLSTGLLTATGAAPELLLDFSGFSDPLTIGDFRSHPVNAFWLATLVTLLAATLAAVAVDRRVSALAGPAAVDAEIMSALGQLDPEQPETWQHPALQADADLAAVLANLLGHYHLQQAKLMRYVDLEGELHRLESAVADADLDQLGGTWETPSAGSLADQMVRVIGVQQSERQQVNERLRVLDDQGPDLVTGLRDARRWQSVTLDHVNQQGAGAERVARQLARLAETVSGDSQPRPQLDRLRQALQAVQDAMAAVPVRSPERQRDAEAPLMTLVERASRLAFQIAMEVARLGAKGERLLPLTQDLEELTTELRRSTDHGERNGQDAARDQALDAVRGRLAELDPTLIDGADDGALAAAVQKAAPLATQTAEALAQIARGFNVQTARLAQLLDTAGDLTGIDTGGEGDAEAAPGSGLAVEQFDPFGSRSTPESGLVADPFASSGGSIFDTTAVPGLGSDFRQTALPGEDDPTIEPVEPTPPLRQESMVVPPEEETIYDLLEFDAKRLPSEPAAEPDAPVHDLSEFGAVKIS